eukprot:TRINITY_DN52377_c0_g1_i1.p1 TRINITY_DN52377_c0_g1~~TRINITY_DN52377_c0_g1_i1.p1  ORF type:complete len:940 (+),score=181.52 TRINITY_DN52377_c0_g1_i1:180-2999(+)
MPEEAQQSFRAWLRARQMDGGLGETQQNPEEQWLLRPEKNASAVSTTPWWLPTAGDAVGSDGPPPRRVHHDGAQRRQSMDGWIGPRTNDLLDTLDVQPSGASPPWRGLSEPASHLILPEMQLSTLSPLRDAQDSAEGGASPSSPAPPPRERTDELHALPAKAAAGGVSEMRYYVGSLRPEGSPAWAQRVRSGESPSVWARCESISENAIEKARDGVMTTVMDGDKVEVIELEHDLYAFSVVTQVSGFLAFFMPLLSACVQLSVLYFLAYSNENIFDEGKWLRPISEHMSLNGMKLISILVSLFKVATELQHAQQLCRALLVGEFEEQLRIAAGWWALCLQYCMALCVLFVSLSVVLGCRTCVSCILKIFSVFVIVDMDNLAARFLEGLFYMDFTVVVDSEKVASIRRRKGLVGGLPVRVVFMVMPVTLIVVTWSVSVYLNTLPLTLLKFGRVQNREPPMMLTDVGDCCPPHLKLQKSGGEISANVSLMLLAQLPSEGVMPAAPRIFWIALRSQTHPRAPSSLQVLEGRDADNNPAFASGSVDAVRTQAYFWMQQHKVDVDAYYQLLKQEKLYKATIPYEANFELLDIKDERVSYTYIIFATAQNPQSLALAELPAQSAPLIRSACAPLCSSCDIRGPHLCDAGQCMKGAHYNEGKCYPCAENCANCDFSALPMEEAGINLTEEGSGEAAIPCYFGGCMDGFGLIHGRCLPCEVDDCRNCDEDLQLCQVCNDGLGLDVNGTCQRCAAPHCRCTTKGGCEECEDGWGPAGNNTCLQCLQGCKKCSVSVQQCMECDVGFVLDNLQCQQCISHCTNCSYSGSQRCDECRSGFGYNAYSQECLRCRVQNCIKCDGSDINRCAECKQGFGVTPGGECENCGDFCTHCRSIGDCRACESGYTVEDGKCMGCADRCLSCLRAGPGRCDRCFDGFHLIGEVCELGSSA